MDLDYLGFQFGNKHSYYDFGIYRTSNGSRYNDSLVPTLTDKAVDVPGGDGQYYFHTKHKQKAFSINFAFEELEESKFREMRQWLDGKSIQHLIFDEHPYKFYCAKVTGNPQINFVCFEESGKRIYKGEGTIQFTCYYPYAQSLETTKSGGNGKALNNYNIQDYPNKNEWTEASKLTDTYTESQSYGINKGDLPAPFVLTYETRGKSPSNPEHTGHGTRIAEGAKFVVGDCYIELHEDLYAIKWDSKTGIVLGKKTETDEYVPVYYTGKSYGAIPVGGLTTKEIYAYVKESGQYGPWRTHYPDNTAEKENEEPTAWYFPCTIKYNYIYY